jgi:hypothetical protein
MTLKQWRSGKTVATATEHCFYEVEPAPPERYPRCWQLVEILIGDHNQRWVVGYYIYEHRAWEVADEMNRQVYEGEARPIE